MNHERSSRTSNLQKQLRSRMQRTLILWFETAAFTLYSVKSLLRYTRVFLRSV